MLKNYNELSNEEKEALINICKEDPANFVEAVLDIKIPDHKKIYIREVFRSFIRPDKKDFRTQYFGEPVSVRCKICNGTGMIPIGPGIRGITKCPACNGRKG